MDRHHRQKDGQTNGQMDRQIDKKKTKKSRRTGMQVCRQEENGPTD
jgi:hypothetical protein